MTSVSADTTDAVTRTTLSAEKPGRWWVEALLIVFMDMLYELIRSLAPTHPARAVANAHAIERLENWLHLGIEPSLNSALEHLPWLIPPMSVYYQIGHLLGLIGALVWAWSCHRSAYARARNALLGLSLTALAGYWLFPTAPPRLAMPGIVDTLAEHPVFLAGHDNVTGMVNLYAAMPSLHVAWAVWVALTITHLSRRRVRYLVWLHPIATTAVVLTTGNHYIADAVVGALLAVLAWRIACRFTPIHPGVIDITTPS